MIQGLGVSNGVIILVCSLLDIMGGAYFKGLKLHAITNFTLSTLVFVFHHVTVEISMGEYLQLAHGSGSTHLVFL
jgi:hypothetical protein